MLPSTPNGLKKIKQYDLLHFKHTVFASLALFTAFSVMWEFDTFSREEMRIF